MKHFICGASLLVLLLAAPTPAQSTSQPGINATTRTEVAEKFAQELADEYAYAEKGQEMARAIQEKLKSGAYERITSPAEFAAALQHDARAVTHDLHLRVGFSGGGGRGGVMRRGPLTPQMIERLRKQNASIPEVRILDGNIGYMPINGMLPARVANDAIAAAFAFLHNTDALILDLRANSGGSGYAEVYLSYLSEGAPYVTGCVHWRKDNRVQTFKTTDMGAASYGAKKPVFVLTSHQTFSAAEGLAYEIQAFKRGTLVGETTGGGANPSAGGGMVQLGHGFLATIPKGYVVSAATGTNWEGVGVKPDVQTPADEALAKAWSLAAKRLAETEIDPKARTEFEILSLAKLDGAPSLSSSRIAGDFVRADSAEHGVKAPVSISEKDGILRAERVLWINGERQEQSVLLTPAGGDRYSPQGGVPGSGSLTFYAQDGKVKCLLVDRNGASILEPTRLTQLRSQPRASSHTPAER